MMQKSLVTQVSCVISEKGKMMSRHWFGKKSPEWRPDLILDKSQVKWNLETQSSLIHDFRQFLSLTSNIKTISTAVDFEQQFIPIKCSENVGN